MEAYRNQWTQNRLIPNGSYRLVSDGIPLLRNHTWQTRRRNPMQAIVEPERGFDHRSALEVRDLDPYEWLKITAQGKG